MAAAKKPAAIAGKSVTSSMPVDRELLVSEVVTQIAPHLRQRRNAIAKECPIWPGDVFALAASLLAKSGAYSCIGSRCPPHTAQPTLHDWSRTIRRTAREWRQCWIQNTTPRDVQQLWTTLCGYSKHSVADILKTPDLLHALLNLVAISDESLAGAGLIPISWNLSDFGGSENVFYFWLNADALLNSHLSERGESTLCETIDPTRARVLPKSQTPCSGLTIRSWTHHLALCPSTDVRATWHGYGAMNVGDDLFCNLLLVPWPFDMRPRQFAPALTNQQRESVNCVHKDVNWFRYELVDYTPVEMLSRFEKLLTKAEKTVGPIHVAVLPELALRPEQFSALSRYLDERAITLISGVLVTGDDNEEDEQAEPPSEVESAMSDRFLDRNKVWVSIPMIGEDPLVFSQGKHHRWRLDRSQIVRYGLSSTLDPERRWWEGIKIDERTINFIRLRRWLSLSVLICEDLARLEPVGEFVRSVAPDLVIALLLDGPQLRRRWPAYYATVLADDPGSSVLTLTSLGMTKLSRPDTGYGGESEPAIALWRDAHDSNTVEIRLPRDRQAAVLTLNRGRVEEWTADGRQHVHNFGAPVFGGVNFLGLD